MKKKSMAISSMFYMIIGLFLFLVLTFIYFGGTGFFQKIYKVTDKLGITQIAKSVEETEKNITEGRYELTPEEKAAEEQIKAAVNAMIPGIEACLSGQNCVCQINAPRIPEGYAIRFINGQDKKVYLSAFRYKSIDWRTDYDENFQGSTGVHFVAGATHKFENIQACLVNDLEEHYFDGDDDVDEIQIINPASMVQLYWSGEGYRATEATGTFVFNLERDYYIYGNNGPFNAVYKTSAGNLCFFVQRFYDDDTELVDNIACGKSEEEEV